jgi:hypothetical protein
MSTERTLATLRAAAAVALAGMLTGCSGQSSSPTSASSPTVKVVSVLISGTAPVTGARAQFTATVVFSDGTTKDATNCSCPNDPVRTVEPASWSSSNPGIAGVNYGLVTGVTAGEADITATYQGVVGKVRVTIVKLPSFRVWTGTYTTSPCMDINPPGLILLQFCLGMSHTQHFKLTLSQFDGTFVGTYDQLNEFIINTCPLGCSANGGYGNCDMSGTVAPDGSFSIQGTGCFRGSGTDGDMSFKLRQDTPATFTGTVDGLAKFGGVTRAAFSGVATATLAQ